MSEFYTNVTQLGSKIHYRGYRDGKPFTRSVEYKPTIYLPSQDKNSEWKTLDGFPVEPFAPGNISETKQFIERYRDVANFSYYGMTTWTTAFIADEYHGQIDYDASLVKIGWLDIETESDDGFPDVETANKAITAISICYRDTYFVLGCGEFVPPSDDIKYIKCRDEKELLVKFLNLWERLNLDIVSTWNGDTFDIPYLVHRISRILSPEDAKRLSPLRKLKERIFPSQYGKDQKSYELLGMAHIDYLPLYKKFGEKSQESYRLGAVCHDELNLGKIDYSEFGNLHTLYKENYQKFIEYNIHDTRLLLKLDNKKRLMELIMNLAYTAKVNYLDCFKQTMMWDAIIYNYLKDRKIVIPQKKKVDKDQKFEGAYVKEPVPGKYEWVVNFDFDSLYPHLIMHYGIGPDTFVGKVDVSLTGLLDRNNPYLPMLKEKNLAMAANGALFTKDKKGFLADIMETMYAERKAYKKRAIAGKIELEALEHEIDSQGETPERLAKKTQLENEIAQFNTLQAVKKRCLNSCYGTIGSPAFRFFHIDQAEAITLSGQLAIRWVEERVNERLNKMFKTNENWTVYQDTDSAYLQMKTVVKHLNKDGILSGAEIVDKLDSFVEKIMNPMLEEVLAELKDLMNAPVQAHHLKREKIANVTIFAKKKRYMQNVWDDEGVRHLEPEVKVTGLTAIRSSTPEICRDRMKHAFWLMMNKDEKSLQAYIEEFYEEFKKLPFEEIAMPTSANGMNKYSDKSSIYAKGCPIHIRGGLLFNHYLKEYRLDNRFENIKDGEKLRYCYMKMPNPFKENVLSAVGPLPKEFKMNQYIDYDTQFDKTFREPLRQVMDLINWKVEEVATLEDFFS